MKTQQRGKSLSLKILLSTHGITAFQKPHHHIYLFVGAGDGWYPEHVLRFDSYGIYFDGSLSGLIQCVFTFHAALVIISAPAFLLAIEAVRKNLFARLLCFYAFPVASLVFVLLMSVSYNAPMTDMEIWIHPIMVVIFIIIHSIFYIRLSKPGFITA